MWQSLGGASEWQVPFDAAVVIPTTLRPTLARALQSVFAQDFAGRVQILIGIDQPPEETDPLGDLGGSRPARMAITIASLPYSTSARHGGLYPNFYGGALRSILTLAANSRLVAYLDDDNWWAPDHLSGLVAAIEGHDWAWSQRIFADPVTGETIALDDWESVGPGAGVYAEGFGGFVDPSSLMIDKIACHDVVALWSLAGFADGSGEDRLILNALASRHRGSTTNRATSYYAMHPHDRNHAARVQRLREAGITLPSSARASITPLSVIIAGLERGNGGGETVREADFVLRALLPRLKPREIVVLSTENSVLPLQMARILREEGLAADILVGGHADEADYRAAVARLGREAVAWPPSRGDLGVYLAAHKVAADLVAIGGRPDLAAAALALLRPGGMLLGAGAADSAIERLAAEAGAQLLPVDLDGLPAWLMQKA
jgi:hypothetical protein